ncbi:uncharacterized protein LY89DRAFT_713742 [Mollisia scopiformis]|uniref:Uncharacterized protein n=1 Tax=Mollisia scopiformis TaxID=149040 RepID=A0A194XSW7_MOLSC|nr:uncharacterized protein LY89DRAFT_713742 [Mollisia scopiformis]KUJ23236.1 hypothetical protein LY89DRAFT_713742 [Mollisia scopiformis]
MQSISQNQLHENDMGTAASLVHGPVPRPPLSGPASHSTAQSRSKRSHLYDEHESPANTTVRHRNALETSSREEVEELKTELDSVNRRLYKAEANVQKLEMEKLESLDRFQPVFDDHIIAKIKSVEQKLNTLVSFLVKCSATTDISDLGTTLAKYTWFNRFSRKLIHIDCNNRVVLRKALRSVTWMFLHHELFSTPFLCFGSEVGEQLSNVFATLYEEPHLNAESVKWRCLTVKQLEASKICQSDDITCRQLHEKFQLRMGNMRYNITEAGLFKEKSKKMFEAAIQLAKLFASQRAIFELFDPPKELWFKAVDSEYCTNVNSTDEKDDQVERSGVVAFIVSPALRKRGDGKGDNLNESTLLTNAFVHLALEHPMKESFVADSNVLHDT